MAAVEDPVTTTGLGCLALNEAWEGFRARGQLPASTPDPIDMGMLLRRQLILLQLYRIFACRPRLPPIRLLVLGVGRDDQFVRLATNPELHVTCVDKPVVVEETRGRHGRADFKGMDIVTEIASVEAMVADCDVLVAEGLFIYLPLEVTQRILAAVEQAGAIIVFNMESSALKRHIPLMIAGFEEISRGALVKLAEMPASTWTRLAGHGEGDPNVEVWVCCWVSSRSSHLYQASFPQ